MPQAVSPGFPPLKIGEWRQHLPWQRSTYVTQSDSKVYFASEWAVVEIDKADRSQRFLTKVEGLSDVGMRLIRYSKAADILIWPIPTATWTCTTRQTGWWSTCLSSRKIST
ncbi:MAG: hypothetical protein IPK76_16645 [Lewinellaceae bacterium]|nr:hypothetical protein [Lewinellaceae bacterium]